MSIRVANPARINKRLILAKNMPAYKQFMALAG
jgi:hypothetical protein